jgi:hypothetical protein
LTPCLNGHLGGGTFLFQVNGDIESVLPEAEPARSIARVLSDVDPLTIRVKGEYA